MALAVTLDRLDTVRGFSHRLDTGTVIANAKCKDGFAVIDFCFDMPRLGVPASVPECFPCNLVHVVTYQGRQSAGLTFDDHPVGGPVRAVGLSEFLSKCRQGSFKITGLDPRSSQVLDSLARLDNGLVAFFQSRIQRCDELRGTLRDAVAQGLQ